MSTQLSFQYPLFSEDPFKGYVEKVLRLRIEKLEEQLRDCKNSNRTFKGNSTKRKQKQSKDYEHKKDTRSC